jgi:hypothetical protein
MRSCNGSDGNALCDACAALEMVRPEMRVAVRLKKPAAGFPARALDENSCDAELMPVICPTVQDKKTSLAPAGSAGVVQRPRVVDVPRARKPIFERFQISLFLFVVRRRRLVPVAAGKSRELACGANLRTFVDAGKESASRKEGDLPSLSSFKFFGKNSN